jgi:hypothetical protein
MRNLKVILALGGGLVAAVVVACSSSSTPAAPAPDAGDTNVEDSNTPQSCIPLTASGLCPSAMGLTCCLSGIPGTCTPQADCTASIQVACTSKLQCGASQVCCADFGGTDGGLASLLQDGGLTGIDASSINLDAGAAGISSLLSGVNFKVTCETSCSNSQIQACANNSECVGGGSCVPLGQIIGDAGLGDAGAPAGLGAYASELGMEMACIPADGGTLFPVVDSGSDSGVVSEAGTEAGTADGGVHDAAPDAP